MKRFHRTFLTIVFVFSIIGMAATPALAENSPPELSVDAATVNVLEGQLARNDGAVSDPNDDPVSLSASVGDVVDNEDGTWEWSYATTDDSQTVTITANDGNGGVTTVDFELVVLPLYVIIDDTTGGDCSLIGTWTTEPGVFGAEDIDMCTLTQDVNGMVLIEDSTGVSLNGNGHSITTGGLNPAVVVFDSSGIILQNLDVSGSEKGIHIVVSAGVFVFNSLIHDNSEGISIEDSGIVFVTNSLIHDNSVGISTYNSGALFVFNNTIVNNTNAGIYNLHPVFVDVMGGVGMIVYNNIVASNGDGGIVVEDDPDELTMLAHNDVWDHTDDYWGCEPGLNDISQDPMFVDPGEGNYRLEADSPVIDAGWDPIGFGQLFPTDLDGNPRVVDGDCDGTATEDMGAYEYIPSNCPPVLSVDAATVNVLEGQLAQNGDAVSDPNDDSVSLSASVGDVVNNGDGTWSWSYSTTGPDDSQTVTITADDGNGGVTTVDFELVVQTTAGATDATDALMDDVQALADSGVLKPNQANGLLNPLNNAIRSLDKGLLDAACNQLQDFADEVAQKIVDGALTEEQAQPLFDAVYNIMASIGCGA